MHQFNDLSEHEISEILYLVDRISPDDITARNARLWDFMNKWADGKVPYSYRSMITLLQHVIGI